MCIYATDLMAYSLTGLMAYSLTGMLYPMNARLPCVPLCHQGGSVVLRVKVFLSFWYLVLHFQFVLVIGCA